MKATVLLVLSLCCGLSAPLGADCLDSLQEIREATPCKNRPVRVTAYLNASKHGAWLSGAVGSLKNAIPLGIEQSASDPSIQQIKSYLYRPQDHQSKTFEAEFYGTIECGGERGLPTINVKKATGIRVSEIVAEGQS